MKEYALIAQSAEQRTESLGGPRKNESSFGERRKQMKWARFVFDKSEP